MAYEKWLENIILINLIIVLFPVFFVFCLFFIFLLTGIMALYLFRGENCYNCNKRTKGLIIMKHIFRYFFKKEERLYCGYCKNRID